MIPTKTEEKSVPTLHMFDVGEGSTIYSNPPIISIDEEWLTTFIDRRIEQYLKNQTLNEKK